jgi:hypothetical protein
MDHPTTLREKASMVAYPQLVAFAYREYLFNEVHPRISRLNLFLTAIPSCRSFGHDAEYLHDFSYALLTHPNTLCRKFMFDTPRPIPSLVFLEDIRDKAFECFPFDLLVRLAPSQVFIKPRF